MRCFSDSRWWALISQSLLNQPRANRLPATEHRGLRSKQCRAPQANRNDYQRAESRSWRICTEQICRVRGWQVRLKISNNSYLFLFRFFLLLLIVLRFSFNFHFIYHDFIEPRTSGLKKTWRKKLMSSCSCFVILIIHI